MELKSNPGGVVPVEGIIGRDELCRSVWNTLDVQSVVITAERRIGKTSLLRKMAAESPAGWVVLSHDLESLHTASDFANGVYKDVEQHLSRWKRTALRARQLLTNVGGVEVGGIIKLPTGHTTPWKPLLTQAIEDLIQEQQDSRLVFFWDEVPFMLQGISAREGEAVAMEILDVLRSLRQKHPTFRMVLTGSVGLHHVIGTLKDQGYSNAPVNDMYEIEVPPLEHGDACELARALIAGEHLATESLDETIDAMAKAADCVPFYIHHIVRQLKISNSLANPQSVAKTVLAQLLDANDPWNLGHYRDRIKTYYPGSEKLVMTILDALALASSPLRTDDILQLVSSTIEFDDRDRLLDLLRLLERDHYLKRRDGGYTWKFPLIARWWRLDRDLQETEG
ncbi:MAG: hypothetical protein ABI614_17165 [Planctomycetota bacterium]